MQAHCKCYMRTFSIRQHSDIKQVHSHDKIDHQGPLLLTFLRVGGEPGNEAIVRPGNWNIRDSPNIT